MRRAEALLHQHVALPLFGNDLPELTMELRWTDDIPHADGWK
jgi:hypothetical protein